MDALARPSARRGPTLWIGNLDAELSWERYRLGSHAQLPIAVHRSLAAAAATMLVYAKPGDELWLPAAFDAQRIGRLLSPYGVELRFDRPPRSDRASGVFPWGWTHELTQELGLPAPCPIDTIAEANDRRTSLALEIELGVAVAGCRVISTVAELEQALRDWPHPRAWVLKAPLSASGRSRVRRQGPPALDAMTRARRLLDRFGCLVLEPWLERVADFGTVGWITGSGIELLPTHQLLVDGNGVFRAAVLGAEAPLAVADTAARVGAALAQRGYRGPFGVDSFTYQSDAGLAVRPLCEINARLTFGHLAHAAFGRAGTALGMSSPSGLELGIARGSAAPAGSSTLIAAVPGDPTTIYLRHRSPGQAA